MIVERIEEIRTSLAKSKTEFAELIGYPYRKYAEITGGKRTKPDVDLINAVTLGAGANPSYLLSGEGSMFTTEVRVEEGQGSIAARLKQLRFLLKLTQAKMAERMGEHRPNLSAMENGKREPDKNNLLHLAKNCGVNLNWLLLGTGEVFEGSGEMDTAVADLIQGLEQATSQGATAKDAEGERLLELWGGISPQSRRVLLQALENLVLKGVAPQLQSIGLVPDTRLPSKSE